MYTIFCLYAWRPEEGARPLYRWLWATMWLLGIELRTFGRADNALNHWAISPALPSSSYYSDIILDQSSWGRKGGLIVLFFCPLCGTGLLSWLSPWLRSCSGTVCWKTSPIEFPQHLLWKLIDHKCEVCCFLLDSQFYCIDRPPDDPHGSVTVVLQ